MTRAPRTLSLRELTAALAARQLLLERASLSPAQAIRRLGPLQGQHPPAPYIALAARIEGPVRERLEAAIAHRRVVKTTLMRHTLHLAAAADYPAFAEFVRQFRQREWRARHPHLDAERVSAELRAWLREPRLNTEIRERVLGSYEGVPDLPYAPISFVRVLLPLVQLPPAGFYSDRTRARFVVDSTPAPDPAEAAALVLRRYLVAFGPASLRDAASWSGAAQRDFAPALERLKLIRFRDENGVELLDLPRQPLPPADTPVPARLLAHWDQALLAYADRERLVPPALAPLKLGLAGVPTATVDGRVAASWRLQRDRARAQVTFTMHLYVPRRARAALIAEAKRTIAVLEPNAQHASVVFEEDGRR